MLSQKARYALRAMLCLARQNKPVAIRTIAEGERIPRKFLELILLELNPTVSCTAIAARPAATNWQNQPKASLSPT